MLATHSASLCSSAVHHGDHHDNDDDNDYQNHTDRDSNGYGKSGQRKTCGGRGGEEEGVSV